MQRHVDAVRAALLDSIPYGVDVQKVERDVSMRPPGMPRLPRGHVRVEAHFTGWGSMFEGRRMRLHAEVDLAQPPASAALRWMDRVDRTLRHQTDMAEQAEAAGVHAPIDLTGVFPTGHLLIDRAALDALIALENDPRCWIHQQIEFARVERLEDGGQTPAVTIKGAVLSVPFLFDPLRIGRGYGRSSMLPLWTGDRLILGDPLPDTLAGALIGQPVSRYMTGTPVDDRTIVSVDTVRAAGQAITTIVFEGRPVRLVDTLPAREM